jgi:hypothetical protein
LKHVTGLCFTNSPEEEAFFDCWRFAFEVWQIVGNAPNDWSVRVGVLFGSIHGPSATGRNYGTVSPVHIIFSRLEEGGIKVKGSGAVKVKKASRVE